MTTMRNEFHCRGFKHLDLGSCLLHFGSVRFGFLTLDKGGIVKSCPICRCFLLTCINLSSLDLFGVLIRSQFQGLVFTHKKVTLVLFGWFAPSPSVTSTPSVSRSTILDNHHFILWIPYRVRLM